MKTNREGPLLFASEAGIFRIVSIAKVVSWVVLVIYMISFTVDVIGMVQAGMQWPTEPTQLAITIANLLFAPTIGLFYFLVLQGVSQGLSLGLDIFYELHPDEGDEEIEELEEV
jgi:hypothetical protein